MTLAIGLTVGWQLGSSRPAAAAGETTDLVFLVDGSGSISPDDWQIQKDGLSAAILDSAAFPRNGSIAVGVVQWSFISDSDRTRVEVPLTVLDSLATVNSVINQIQGMVQMQQLTNPGDALRRGTDLLLADGENPAGTDWILCMSTDGITNSGEDLGAAKAYAVASGVDKYTVVAIEDPGVVTGDELKAHYGPHVFGSGTVTVARNSAEMANIVIGGCLGAPVQLRALEVNQSVQDWHNSVPLITNKPATVRAFVQMAPNIPDKLVVGRLFGKRGGADLPGSPLLAENVGGSVLARQDIASRRGVLADSLNFRLPASWRTGTVELTFEAAGAPVTCQEPSGAGADPANDCKVTVSFRDEVTPEVRFIGVRYTSNMTAFEPTQAQLFEQLYRFQSIFPVASINYTMDTMGNYASTPALGTVNSDLAAKRTLDGASSASRYYGVLDGGGGGLANGIPGTVSSGFLSGTGGISDTGYARNRGPHELAHNLDRHHAVDKSLPPQNGLLVGRCGEVADQSAPGHTPFETVNGSLTPVLGPLSNGVDNEIWGLDNRMLVANTHLAVVDPRQTFELMSYCGGGSQGRWVSQFTYAGLMGSFPSAAGGASIASTDFLLVTGRVDFAADTATLAPVIASTGTVPSPLPGAYRVRLLSGSGAELAGADFTPEEMDADALGPQKPTGDPIGLINVSLPKPASPVAAIAITHDGREIGRMNATANNPSVQLVSPPTNVTEPTVTLRWQGSDADPNSSLTYTVMYSEDNGATWKTLTVNTTATELTVPRSDLPASSAARLKVVASDGVRTASATSNQFAVADNAPFVATDHLVHNGVFSSVQNLHLRGAGFDAEDGALSDTALAWSSNINGPLGTGPELTLNAINLTAGTHQITLAATDSAGKTATTTQTVHIFRVAPPRPGITITAGGPYPGQEGSAVTVTGTVSDPDQLGFTSEWSIRPNGDTDPGATCAIADPAALSTTVTCTDNGSYTVTLTARDGVSPLTVSRTATVTLTNVNPAVSVSTPANGTNFAAQTPVTIVAPFTDAGRNDTHTCTIDFGDGSPVVKGQVNQAPGSGTCTATHAYTKLGPQNVVVTVTDDNGGTATARLTVVIYLPGEAFAFNATGLVAIGKTPLATCPPDQSRTVAELNVVIARVNGLNASCGVATDSGRTTARASVEQASLLGGAITITGIQSTCVSDASGVTRGSSVGRINGVPIGTGSGSITIPLVATVYYNETTTGPNGELIQNAIRVQTLLGTQQIILGSCRLG